ncbi:MAG: hypothetical protein K2P85_11085 [Flavobacteriaceae bacterium]|jgi:hypothetical protein|nr:hypothetical protein [Flavobacteriaceae bacterium]
MKRYLLLFLSISSFGFAQNLNEYKYAMVPAKFSFLKESNMYNLNLLTKLYMQKYGFETYYDNETAPDDFVNSNCNKVFVDLVASNSIFTTKVKVVIKDCKGSILMSSEEGTSRDKEFKTAYNEALRMAFDNFLALKTHKYQPSQKSLGMIGEPAEVKTVSTEVKSESKPEIAVVLNQEISSRQLYVQPIANGFQLVNTEPKVVYKIFRTSTKDFFIASKGSVQGVFFLRNNEYFFEYYQNEKLVSEKVEVKF